MPHLAHFGRLLWDATFLGIVVADDSGLVDANDAFLRMVGRTRDELRAKRFTLMGITAPEGLAANQEAKARLEREGSIPMREKVYVRPDGTRVPVMVAVARLPDGRVAGLVIDITERKTLEARLQSSERDRMASVGRLAAGVAHEINNPLTYVMANLEMVADELRRSPDGPPPARMQQLAEMVREARDGAERVRKIVRGMKTFSRAEEERRVPLDVRTVLQQSVALAFHEIKHRARIVTEYGEPPLVEADEVRLAQVFVNLLVNAAHAIPEGQADRNEIRIATRKDDATGHAVVEVRDTGRGIPPEIRSRIFDPFFTTEAIGEGTGLGLSIARNIVAALGGSIDVESEPGRGSTFRVVLPAT